MSFKSKIGYILGPADEKGTLLNDTGTHIRHGIRNVVEDPLESPAETRRAQEHHQVAHPGEKDSTFDKDHSSRKSSKSRYLSPTYKRQNRIGIDIQPIDPEFHVFRPVNWRAIRTHPDLAAADIIKLSEGKIGQAQAWALIHDAINGGGNSCNLGMSKEQYYNDLTNISPYKTNGLVALSLATGKSSYASTPNTPLGKLAPYQTNLADYMRNRQYKYECRLFNFYADNNKYFSGQFTLSGRIGYEYGKRLIWFNQRRRYAWEGYLTGVSHDFRYDANGTGWTTTITVERMLPFTFNEARRLLKNENTGVLWTRDMDSYDTITGKPEDVTSEPIKGDFNKRFNMMWGHAEPFIGGFFGEQTLASMISQANSRESAYMSNFINHGSSGSSKSSGSSSSDIVTYAKSQIGKHPYVYGSHQIITERGKDGSTGDCAGFTWLCAYKCGYKCPSDGWEGQQDLSQWCKKVDSSEAKAGDFITTSDHHMVMGSDYHGGSTDIINLGGDRTGKYHGANVQEGSLSRQVDTPLSANKYWRPEKK